MLTLKVVVVAYADADAEAEAKTMFWWKCSQQRNPISPYPDIRECVITCKRHCRRHLCIHMIWQQIFLIITYFLMPCVDSASPNVGCSWPIWGRWRCLASTLSVSGTTFIQNLISANSDSLSTTQLALATCLKHPSFIHPRPISTGRGD